MALNIDIHDPCHVEFLKIVNEQNVNYWVLLEKQEGIIEELVQDGLDDIEQQHAVVLETNLDTEMCNDEENTIRQPLLPQPSVPKELDQHEETALKSHVYDAIVHLRRG